MNIMRVATMAAIVGGGLYLFGSFGSSTSDPKIAYTSSDVDLKNALNVTVNTIAQVENELTKIPAEKKAAEGFSDQALVTLSTELAVAYNAFKPPLDSSQRDAAEPVRIGVVPLKDASLVAFGDKNNDQKFDKSEKALFRIEVDGENSRVVATGGNGTVSEHAFSGSGMLTGFLIGSMLSRQSSAGATSRVANKRPVSASQARARAATQSRARSRAGSGSHSRGK